MLKLKNFFKSYIGKDSISALEHDTIKIVIAGCIAILVALLVMSITGIAITRNAVVNRLKTIDLKNMAGAIAATIDAKIEKAVDASLLLSYDPMLLRWVLSNDTDKESGQFAKNKLGELVEQFGYDTAFLTSALTHNYWSYKGEEFRLLNVVSPENPADSWFFKTLDMQKKYIINIDPNEVLQETFVWINVLVGDLSDPVAVTGVGLNLSELINELVREEAKYELKNDIWLVDGGGFIYLSKNKDHLEQALRDYLPQDLTETIMEPGSLVNEFAVAEYYNKEGELFDVVYKTIKDTDWKLIVQIPRSESLGFLNSIIINTVVAGLSIVIFMVGMFNFITKRVANPYKRTLQLNQELEEKVRERTRELNEKNIKIQDSIEYAKLIQETILPSRAELGTVLQDFFVIWKPRDIVGGDFYWLKKFADGFLLVIGDCTGHGVPGALMTMAVHSMLNHIVEDVGHRDPAAILEELNRLLSQSFTGSESIENIRPGLDAAVLFVAKDKKILFSGAKLSLIVLEEHSIKEIKGNKVTLDGLVGRQKPGLSNYEIEYDRQRASFYLFTDGFTDQPGGERGLPYGKKRLFSELQAIGNLAMKHQETAILQTFKNYTGNEIIRDDFTILGFSICK